MRMTLANGLPGGAIGGAVPPPLPEDVTLVIGEDGAGNPTVSTNAIGTFYWMIDANASRTKAQIETGGGEDSGTVDTDPAEAVSFEIDLTGTTAGTYYLHGFVRRGEDLEESAVVSEEVTVEEDPIVAIRTMIGAGVEDTRVTGVAGGTSELSSVSAVTFACRITRIAGQNGVLAEGGGAASGLILYIFNNTIYFQAGDGTAFGSAADRFELSVAAPTGTFFVVATADEGAGAGLYIDTTLEDSAASGISVAALSGADPSYYGSAPALAAINRGGWGSNQANGDGAFEGTLEYTAIWDGVYFT